MKLKIYWLVIAVFSFFSTEKLTAQTPAVYTSDDIFLQLKKLNVLGSVLYIAAHPDDENTKLLTYFSKDKLYRTGYLSLTRGDGGQNLIGDEQGIDLGLIRTQELLSARRIDGAEQFFSRAYDFGFSKSADESLRIWNHNKILSDVVWVIRKFQPDVIITRFPGDARAGHGHHAASEILAKEAFTAAADSTMFPEQFKYGVKPWQAKRILWNTFNFGGNNTTSNDQFKMDIGMYNPLLGKSYGEISAESRSQHKSQGFGVPKQRGESIEYFSLTAGAPVKDSLFDGVNTTWQRVNGGNKIEDDVNAIIKNYDFANPENSVKALVQLYQSVEKLPDGYWKKKKLSELKQIIIECSGIFAEATTSNEFAIPQQRFNVTFSVNKRLNADVQLKNIQLPGLDSNIHTTLSTDENYNYPAAIKVNDSMPVSQPYWLQYPLDSIGSFTVKDQQLIGKPQNDAALNATFNFVISGTDISIQKPLQYKFTDPVKGELYEPFIIINPVSVSLQPSVILTNISYENTQPENDAMRVQVKSFIQSSKTKMQLYFVQGKDSTLIKDTTLNFNYNQLYDFGFALHDYYKSGIAPGIAVKINLNGSTNAYSGDLHTIIYDHIPYIHYYATDKVHVINDEIKTVGSKIGYITGAGDKVPQALQQMGFAVTFLSEKDVTAENLKQFKAIITGVRAYNIYDWLYSKYDVLMQYIKNGGNLIVQYNTNNQVGSVNGQIGPYNFNIGRTRVTEENSAVHILLPDDAVLNYPNKIGSADFNNWIQERSTYQADDIDAHYRAILGMHDVNEPETNGSMITAKYGKGNFVYASLVFFRELPAGVPGAYKLMANLIALPGNE